MSKTKARDYRARADGWINGRRRKKGEIVELTPRAAKYENVEPVESGPPPEKPAAKSRAKAGDETGK